MEKTSNSTSLGVVFIPADSQQYSVTSPKEGKLATFSSGTNPSAVRRNLSECRAVTWVDGQKEEFSLDVNYKNLERRRMLYDLNKKK